MTQSLSPFYNLLKLNTRLFQNCFEKVNQELAQKRINLDTNNMIFIAVHIIYARHYLARLLGTENHDPFPGKFEKISNINEIESYPAIEEVLNAWQDISNILIDRFNNISDDFLYKQSKEKFPIEDRTIINDIVFLLQHESFHIGQLAFLRKYLGLGPMSYK